MLFRWLLFLRKSKLLQSCTGEKVEEINSGGRYRYYVAKDKELDVVKKKLSSVKRKVKDCFIIAIYNNKVITVAEARKLESEK